MFPPIVWIQGGSSPCGEIVYSSKPFWKNFPVSQERDLRERERKRRKCRMVVVAGCASASLPCSVPSFLATLAPPGQYSLCTWQQSSLLPPPLSMYSFLLFLLGSCSVPGDSNLLGTLSSKALVFAAAPSVWFSSPLFLLIICLSGLHWSLFFVIPVTFH